MVLLREQVFDEGTPEEGKMGHWGRSYPQHLDHPNTFLGLSREDRDHLALCEFVCLSMSVCLYMKSRDWQYMLCKIRRPQYKSTGKNKP